MDVAFLFGQYRWLATLIGTINVDGYLDDISAPKSFVWPELWVFAHLSSPLLACCASWDGWLQIILTSLVILTIGPFFPFLFGPVAVHPRMDGHRLL